MPRLLLLLSVFFSGTVAGQQYVYVNTDNLIVRDRPVAGYNVFCIAHAPTRLELLPVDSYYVRNKVAIDRYKYIVLHYTDDRGVDNAVYGYVEKKYLASSLAGVTVAGIDTAAGPAVTPAELNHYRRNAYPHRFKGTTSSNAGEYPFPKYKGGNPVPLPAKAIPKVYHPGPRGGCYYLNAAGKRIYVDAKLCAGK